MSDTNQPQFDVDAINQRLDSVSERARIRRVAEEKRRAEEEARLAEEREDNVTAAAAQLRDQFFDRFNRVDVTDANSTDSAIAVFEQCMQLLAGEQLAPATTPVVNPVPTTRSDIPFDWDSRSENQKKVIELVAGTEVTDKRAQVLETVLTATSNRFYVRKSGALTDGQAKDLDKALKDAQATESSTEPEPAPASEPVASPSPTPAIMATKKDVTKKTTVAPAPTSEAAAETEPAASSDEVAGETSTPKKESIWARSKGAGKKLVSEPVKSVKAGISHLD